MSLRAAIAALDASDVGGGCAVVLDGEPPFGVRTFTAALMHVFRLMRVTPGSLYCRHPCEGRDPERGVVWWTCRRAYQRA